MVISPIQPPSEVLLGYRFLGSCEHTVTTFCDPYNRNIRQFRVTASFDDSSLDMERVGVQVGSTVITIEPTLTASIVEGISGAPIHLSAPSNETQYDSDVEGNGGVSVVLEEGRVVVIAREFGVRLTRTKNNSSSLLTLNVSREDIRMSGSDDGGTSSSLSSSQDLCGLCGSLDGELVYSDGTRVLVGGGGGGGGGMGRGDVQGFADSWRVNPGEELLGAQEPSCGELLRVLEHMRLFFFTVLKKGFGVFFFVDNCNTLAAICVLQNLCVHVLYQNKQTNIPVQQSN